jgi:hypothetical protein
VKNISTVKTISVANTRKVKKDFSEKNISAVTTLLERNTSTVRVVSVKLIRTVKTSSFTKKSAQ